jgi:hypothetical protein
MVQPIKESLKTMSFTVMESIFGRIPENMLVCGKIMKCMAWVFLLGRMVVFTTVDMPMGRKKDSEPTNGRISGSMLGYGKMADRMVKVRCIKMAKLKRVNGSEEFL